MIKKKHNNEGKLIYYSIKTVEGGTECPENGSFEEIYEYDKNGILIKVIHKFEGYECLMKLKK